MQSWRMEKLYGILRGWVEFWLAYIGSVIKDIALLMQQKCQCKATKVRESVGRKGYWLKVQSELRNKILGKGCLLNLCNTGTLLKMVEMSTFYHENRLNRMRGNSLGVREKCSSRKHLSRECIVPVLSKDGFAFVHVGMLSSYHGNDAPQMENILNCEKLEKNWNFETSSRLGDQNLSHATVENGFQAFKVKIKTDRKCQYLCLRI